MKNKWEIVVNAANNGKPWQIFDNGTLVAEVHQGYQVARSIVERHNGENQCAS